MNKLIMTIFGALAFLCSAAKAARCGPDRGGGSNGWSDPANYTAGSGYPQSDDSVVIPDTKIAQVTTENDIALMTERLARKAAVSTEVCGHILR